jgi:hypothetical protein
MTHARSASAQVPYSYIFSTSKEDQSLHIVYPYKLKDLSQGARTGCQDCSLLLDVVRGWPNLDVVSLKLHLDQKHQYPGTTLVDLILEVTW